MRKSHSILLLTSALIGSVTIGAMQPQNVSASSGAIGYMIYKQVRQNMQNDYHNDTDCYENHAEEFRIRHNCYYELSEINSKYPIAGVNKFLQESLDKADEQYEAKLARIEAEKKAEKQKKKKEKEEAEIRQKEYEARLIELFGYLPEEWEVNEFLGITQAECGNTEPENGVEAVEYTIINRVKSSHFPNTIHGVLSQRNQFETYTRGLQNSTPNKKVKKVWDKILYENTSNPYSGILFFTAGGYNPYCKPAFKIHNHYFGYWK